MRTAASVFLSIYSVCLHSQNILPSSVNVTSSCMSSWEAISCQSRKKTLSTGDIADVVIIEIFIENIHTGIL